MHPGTKLDDGGKGAGGDATFRNGGTTVARPSIGLDDGRRDVGGGATFRIEGKIVARPSGRPNGAGGDATFHTGGVITGLGVDGKGGTALRRIWCEGAALQRAGAGLGCVACNLGLSKLKRG